jgi:hypothetical protein
MEQDAGASHSRGRGLKMMQMQRQELAQTTERCQQEESVSLRKLKGDGWKPLEPMMECAGSHLASRTCYFRDLMWDSEKERFVLFSNSTPGHIGDRLVLDTDTVPWIHMTK